MTITTRATLCLRARIVTPAAASHRERVRAALQAREQPLASLLQPRQAQRK